MLRAMSKLASFTEAVTWLAERASLEHPTKMHDRATGDDGAPRLSEGFIRWLTRDEPSETPWAFETFTTTVQEDCPRPHPIRAKGEPRCELCDDALWWSKTRPMYVRPFAAALERLRHKRATTPDWPTPYEMVVRLIAARYDLEYAAFAIGHPILGEDHRKTLEAKFISVVRDLSDRYQSGPMPRSRRISDAQASAEAA